LGYVGEGLDGGVAEEIGDAVEAEELAFGVGGFEDAVGDDDKLLAEGWLAQKRTSLSNAQALRAVAG
jgi:hypothetical protein